jgi:Uma2 family endonuclease
VPDLAVEIISDSNTRREMDLKLREYFLAGTQLVWYIDPETHTAEAYTAPDVVTHVPADGALDGGDVLPGFRLPLATLFAHLPPPKPKTRRKRSG